ncbi:MAG: isoprenyl transferase [Bacteroidales bacterium]|jgi:undecaprenyl diphosphate synthase|nr:isoprenyl transferase [Bacteroidales bacterium]
MSAFSYIDTHNAPVHIAIIMDGNGRWAKEQGKERIFGHQIGVQAVRNAVEAASDAGIKYLTLYAFSTENWNRKKEEVEALIFLIANSVRNELENLMKNNVRLVTIGNLYAMSDDCQEAFNFVIEKTRHNTGLTLVIALNYSSRWEIGEAVKKIATQILENKLKINDIDENTMRLFLATSDIPDPDILIRAGREQRISNFMLWQISYTELFFLSVMWPDFTKEHLWQIIHEFQSRERRYGKTSENIS